MIGRDGGGRGSRGGPRDAAGLATSFFGFRDMVKYNEFLI
ncbi:hypothetical protein NAS2_0687 [Conexivisphaera calida]|uniref:Uncharacterized protein n=1 Tax=Conexivisphaera calida TaxID=1874277 RepID=A0A4P2VBZ7_9ARCH|nr:hypothetical protein NAS2_0687 [Conexivisphaera calida]